jgi:hypothetical protein
MVVLKGTYKKEAGSHMEGKPPPQKIPGEDLNPNESTP